MKKSLEIAALFLVACGCAVRVAPPSVSADVSAAPDKAWTKVLSRFVDDKGRIDFAGMAKDPHDLENKVIRPIGDPRVHVVLNCMARGCPRLPREPFRADMLDPELEACAQYFFNEERNVQLEPNKQTVRLSQILQFYTNDFLKKAPSLIAFVNKYREAKIPEGWKVEFIPYDWQLNSQ